MNFDSVIPEDVREAMLTMARNAPAGNFVEVGVFMGGSARQLLDIATEQNRALYCYDTFDGIPCASAEHGDSHVVGDFAHDNEQAVRDHLSGAFVVRGVFPHSAVPMGQIAFAHLDCDQYQSVYESASYLLPRLVDGGVLWFDDAPVLAGAKKAVRELFGESIQEAPVGRWYVVKRGEHGLET